MKGVQNHKTGRHLLSLCVFVLFLTFSADALATENIPREALATTEQSIDAMWTDQTFSPELQKKQQSLRKMLQNEVVSKSDIETVITEAIHSKMNREKTSKYILKKMPERFNELFSPYLEWEDFRQIVWQVGSSAIEDGRQAVISVGTLAPAGTPWINVPEQLIPVIEELTNNKVTIRIYSGGVMGEDTDILRKMDVGQLDGCGCTALGILEASPEASVLLLPGLFNNYEEIDYIFEKFRKRIDASFEKRGYILASLIDTGNFHFFSKNRISSLADIRRSKMLTWFGIVETTLFDELGISAMPVSVTEIISALSTGMADTNLAPAAWMLGMQAYQYANYFIKEPILYSPAAIFVSTGTKDRLRRQFDLSETFAYNIQEMLVFEFSGLEPEWKSQARRYEARCLEAFTTRVGMKAVTLPPEDRKAIEQAGKNVWTRLADRAYPENLLNDILLALDEYRESLQ